jgi:GntR family transcriptional regulator, arabinose operon transcriptional repressor
MKTGRTHHYLRVIGDLEKKIHAGKWKEGNYIPTEKEICKTYAVSRITACRALNELQQMGYIKRQRAKGSLLISRIANVAHEFVCMVMRTEEHLYAPLGQRIIAGLQRHDYQVITQTSDTVRENPEAASRFPPNAKALIIEGVSLAEAEFVRNTMRSIEFSVLVVPHTPSDERFSASVETDFFHGGYIAAKHCADCGYKRLVYFTYPIEEAHWKSMRHHYEGMQAACREKKVELLLRDIADKRQEHWSNGIAQMLEEVGKGCAVLSNMDFLSSLVYRVARDMGWRIPEDLGLVGYYNTPWSISLGMTTLDIQIDLIARQTVDVVHEQRKGRIIIPPTLIVRSSTGTRSPATDKEAED